MKYMLIFLFCGLVKLCIAGSFTDQMHGKLTYTMLIFVFCGLVKFCIAGSFSDQQNVYMYLADNINPRIRPVINQSDVITVSVMVTIMSIQEFNERDQSMTSSLAFVFTWNSETLRWNASHFGGITKLSFFPDEIWTPELTVMNSLHNDFDLMIRSGLFVNVHNNGHTVWFSGGTFKTTCQVNVLKYPFDTQTCDVLLTKANLDTELQLIPSMATVIRTVYIDNEEWFLKSSNIQKQQSTHEYAISSVAISLTLQRRPLFYIVNTILPVELIAVLNILSFKIPPLSGERMGYCVALLLTFAFLLSSTAETMPRQAKDLLYLQIYINSQFILSGLAMTLSALIVKAELSSTIPWWLQLLMNQCPRKNGVRNFKLDEGDLNSSVDSNPDKTNSNQGNHKYDIDVDASAAENQKENAINKLDNALFNLFVSLFVISTSICAALVLS